MRERQFNAPNLGRSGRKIGSVPFFMVKFVQLFMCLSRITLWDTGSSVGH